MSKFTIYFKKPVFVLAFLCLITNAFAVSPYKKIERNLELGYLDKAYQEIFKIKLDTKDISDPEFWILEAKIELELHKTTIYAYQKVVENPLLKCATATENALKFAGNRIELFQIWTPFLNELERVLFNEAGKRFNDKLYAEANVYYEPLISLFPKSDYYKYSGVSYFKDQSFRKAESKFLSTISYPNQDPTIYKYSLESIKLTKPYNITRYDSVLSKAVLTFPDNFDFIRLKISFLEENKSPKNDVELFKLYQKMVDFDPKDKTMSYNYAVQLYNIAVENYEKDNLKQAKEFARKSEIVVENYLKTEKDPDGIFESLKRKVKLLYLQ